MHKVQDKPENGKEVLNFFNWAFENGAKSAEELDYVALPKDVTDQIKAAWHRRSRPKTALRSGSKIRVQIQVSCKLILRDGPPLGGAVFIM